MSLNNQGDKTPPVLWKKPPLNLGGSGFDLRKIDKNIDPSPDFTRLKFRSRAFSDGGLHNVHVKFDMRKNISNLDSGDTVVKLPSRHGSQKEIEFEGDLPKSGTMSAILNWLIFNSDKLIIQKFLVRYNQFETAENLFQFLQDKYKEIELNPKKAEKVLSFLLIWIDCYFSRDFQRTGCLKALESFLQYIKVGEHTGLVRKIKLCLLKRAGHVPISQVFVNSITKLTPSKSKRSGRSKKINYLNNEQMHFSSISPENFAEQLTLIESELFKEIQESDLLEKVWLSKNPPKNNPLCLMINLFNRISIWCASEIVSVQDLKERVNMLRKFISIAEHCYELKNFNALMALTASMNLTAVQRLEKTWSLVGNSYKSSFDKFTNLMSTKQNFQNYRSLLNNTKLPLVPYLGVFLRDLTFIDEGNSDYFESGLINFDKLILMGNFIVDIKYYQKSVYNIEMNSSILSFFDNIAPPSEEEVYIMSTKIEEEDTSLD